MKKLTVLCGALLMAATSFAAVEYVLPEGAVTNDYGWTSKGDMFTAFMADAGATGFETLDYYLTQDNPLGGTNICGKLTNAAPALTMEKWAWLKTYIEDVTTKYNATSPTNPVTLAADGTGATWRYAVGAFFCSIKYTGWPYSADFTDAGQDAAYIPVWKHAFANPTEITEGEFTLNAPYKEGESFRGWFDNEAGSGTPVTKITPESTGKLYACFGEYINTVAEVLALADGTTTNIKGTCTYTAGSNFWIQDATGAILCYGKDNGVALNEEVVLEGKFVANFKGSPELEVTKVVSHVAGTAITPAEVTLSGLVADVTPYLNKLVSVKGVQIDSYVDNGSYITPYVTDGINKLALYKYTGVTEDKYPVGTQINFKAVISIFNTTLQFRGEEAWIEVSAAAVKDSYNYPARGEEGEYTLENNWIYSVKLSNYVDNRPGEDGNVRGMAVKDGKMYFIDRGNTAFQVFDGATGKKLKTLPITGEHLFQIEATNDKGVTEWTSAVTLAYNDVKVDNAGNLLIGACLTSSQTFFIYKVDETTGAATEVIKERLWDNTEDEFDKISYRFDAFGVYGDVNSHAVIMAQDANSMTAFKWVIDEGKAAKAEKVVLYVDPVNDNSYLLTADGDSKKMKENPGTAPQIFPVDDNYFYLDGNETYPTLFNMNGTLADDFKNCTAGIAVANNEGDTCKMNQGHNGIVEFQVGDEYFLVMAATNTAGSPSSAFALYKFKDASKAFADMTPMWFFPNDGMSFSTSVNGFRTAVPSVEVDGKVATIYLYAGNVGYAAYTFTGKEATAVKNITDNKAEQVEKIMENGQVYILKNGVRYNVLGVQVEK